MLASPTSRHSSTDDSRAATWRAIARNRQIDAVRRSQTASSAAVGGGDGRDVVADQPDEQRKHGGEVEEPRQLLGRRLVDDELVAVVQAEDLRRRHDEREGHEIGRPQRDSADDGDREREARRQPPPCRRTPARSGSCARAGRPQRRRGPPGRFRAAPSRAVAGRVTTEAARAPTVAEPWDRPPGLCWPSVWCGFFGPAVRGGEIGS